MANSLQSLFGAIASDGDEKERCDHKLCQMPKN
jgi:hypothetical protein